MYVLYLYYTYNIIPSPKRNNNKNNHSTRNNNN